MSQNAEDETKDIQKEKDNIDMMLNNNTESYLIMKCQNVKGCGIRNKKCLINYEEMKNNVEDIPNIKTRKRTNSVDLYKKHKRQRDKKTKTLRPSSRNLKINNNLCEISENSNLNSNKKSNKNLRNDKEKKVYFPKNFVCIIDVESYKKYNEENTSKDPFEDMEFLQKISNMNNSSCLDIIYKKQINEDEGKAQVNCTCQIF